MKFALRMTDQQYDHITANLADYRRFDTDTVGMPKILINVPNGNHYTTPELLASPELMLKNSLDTVQTHIDIGDDYIPQVRVEFGTGQVAHAFGSEMYIPMNSPVCSKNHVLMEAADMDTLEMPALDAGWFSKNYAYTEYYMEHKPDFVGLLLPDLQSPFNNAHLIRGNDILYDFYDEPERLHRLLKICGEYQAKLIQHYRSLTGMEEGYHYDWGGVWKGNARLSNCSLHMVSTAFYRDFIKPHDTDLLQKIHGGRIHYCGEHDDGLMEEFFGIEQMYGVDFDGNYHNIFELSKRAPAHVTLLEYFTPDHIQYILENGYRGKKKNLMIQTSASSVEEGKALYQKLKTAILKGQEAHD